MPDNEKLLALYEARQMAHDSNLPDFDSMFLVQDAGYDTIRHLVAEGEANMLACPSFGLFGGTPDVPKMPACLQMALSFQNGVRMFDWGQCVKMPSAVISLQDPNRLLAYKFGDIHSQAMKDYGMPLEKPLLYSMSDMMGTAQHKSDMLIKMIDWLATAKGTKVLFIDGARDLFPSPGEYVRRLRRQAYMREMCVVGTYSTKILFESPQKTPDIHEGETELSAKNARAWNDALRMPLSNYAFGEAMDATGAADWILITLQVPRTAVTCITGKKIGNQNTVQMRYFACKFITSMCSVPQGLKFLARTDFPMLFPLELHS